jgi:hypothetical protein
MWHFSQNKQFYFCVKVHILSIEFLEVILSCFSSQKVHKYDILIVKIVLINGERRIDVE